jgi:hypothetical protein
MQVRSNQRLQVSAASFRYPRSRDPGRLGRARGSLRCAHTTALQPHRVTLQFFPRKFLVNALLSPRNSCDRRRRTVVSECCAVQERHHHRTVHGCLSCPRTTRLSPPPQCLHPLFTPVACAYNQGSLPQFHTTLRAMQPPLHPCNTRACITLLHLGRHRVDVAQRQRHDERRRAVRHTLPSLSYCNILTRFNDGLNSSCRCA